MGVWGFGIGPNPQSPIPNPQSPIPKIRINKILTYNLYNLFNILKLLKLFNQEI